jgi:squalene-associated FAD-dependent desaturase
VVQQQQPEVIVIGAGCAGLAAAVALTARGRRVLVLEARGRLGGRASAYFDKVTGESVDNGQHVLAGCYDHTFAFLDTIGARDRVYLQRSLEVGFVDERGKSSVLKCPQWRSPWHLVGGVLRWRALTWADKMALLKFGRQLPKLPVGVRRDETVEQWLVRNGQTPRLRKMLWEPLALAALHQEAKGAAATPFAMVLKSMFGGGPRRAALGLPLVPLEQLFGDPAREYITANGGEVRMHSLARVVVRHGRIGGVELRGDSLQAKQVICAVPWFGLASVLQDDEQGRLKPILTAAAAMTPSPIVTVNVWFDRPVLSRPFVGLPGRVTQWAFDTRALWKLAGKKMPEPPKPGEGKDGAAVAAAAALAAVGDGTAVGVDGMAAVDAPVDYVPHLSLVSSGADAVLRYTNEQLVSQALDDLRAAFPTAGYAKVLRATVVREPYATFSVAQGQPARPQPRTPIEGLWLAGDWTDTGLPGTIEGAVLSGHRAAEAADDAIEAARARELRDQEERRQRPTKPKAKAHGSALHSPVGDQPTSPEAQRTSEHEHGVEHEKL